MPLIKNVTKWEGVCNGQKYQRNEEDCTLEEELNIVSRTNN
jgi:hypothetical protein